MWHNFSKSFLFPIEQTRLWNSQGLCEVWDWLRWWGKLCQGLQGEMLLLLKNIQWKKTRPSHHSRDLKGPGLFAIYRIAYLKNKLLLLKATTEKEKEKKKAKQETRNTEDHCLPAFEMKDGKPHFTDILSSCKAQAAPVLSLYLDQVWKRLHLFTITRHHFWCQRGLCVWNGQPHMRKQDHLR